MDCRWNEGMSVFREMNFYFNDKLTLSEGKLHLEKGKNKREDGEVVAVDANAVANYLKAMIDPVAKGIFQQMESEKSDTPAFYERVADFNRELKTFKVLVWHLEITYRGYQPEAEKLYDTIYRSADKLQELVKSFKRKLNEPPVEQRPRLHADYHERTSIHFIREHHSKRVPLQETVAAAKKALLLAGVDASAKIDWLSEPEINYTHMMAFKKLATQLLHTPYITEEVAKAFAEVAEYADHLDLEEATLASLGDPSVLIPYITKKGDRSVEEFLKQFNSMIVSLEDVVRMYKTQSPQVLFGKPSKSLHFITPAALQILLQASLDSSERSKITLSKDLSELESVKKFLKDNLYNVQDQNARKVEYMRFW